MNQIDPNISQTVAGETSSNPFSSILQQYLFLSAINNRRTSNDSANSQSEIWPSDFNDLSMALSEGLEFFKISAEENANGHKIEFDESTLGIGCVGYNIDSIQFWVPTALLRLLPYPETLLSLNSAAEQHRLFEDSRLCISGSAVIMGVVPWIGDFDLFEYVASQTVDNALYDTDPYYKRYNVVCKEVSVGNSQSGKMPKGSEKWKKLAEDIAPSKMRTYAAKYLDKYNYCKLDMIGEFAENISEITNIVYKFDGPIDLTKPFPSFPHQEIVVGPNPPTPESYSLRNYGDYVFWLRDEIDNGLNSLEAVHRKLYTQKLIKLAKRATMLATMVGLDDYVSDFTIAFEARESLSYSITSSIKCLQPLVEDVDDEEQYDLASKLMQRANDNLQKINEHNCVKLDNDELVSRINHLLQEFDNMCFPCIKKY